jgi:tetratricopeptide (TPR) repeat protein
MGLDAGGADAGTALDAGADAGRTGPAAGTAGVKRPAPVRDFDYYMTQGNRLRERERFEAALEAYGEAAELEPDRAEPYSGRGMAYLDLGDARQAATEFKQALKINANYGEAIIGLAETYRSQGKKAEAIRYYERYLEVLPNGPEASVARSAIERLKE